MTNKNGPHHKFDEALNRSLENALLVRVAYYRGDGAFQHTVFRETG